MNTFKIISMQCLLLAMCIVANAEEAPSNEIWYSSSDGKIINLERQNVFDIRILSNNYSNGKGINKFNGDEMNIGDFAFHCKDSEQKNKN